MAFRDMTAKYNGKCAGCGGAIKRGDRIEYDTNNRKAYHYGAGNGDYAGKCYAERQKPRDFIDIDRIYEDQCADICGQ